MKIVVLHPKMEVLGGGERLCLSACQALIKDGHEVKVLCDDVRLEKIEKIFGKNFNIELCPTFKPFKPFLINRFLVYQRFFQASRQIKKVKKYLKDADVIFSTQDVSFLPHEKYAYTIQYVHFPEYLVHRERAKGLSLFFWNIYYYPIRQWIWGRLDNVDLFLCNSGFTKGAITERWSKDAEIIYPPVEIEEFVNSEEKIDQVISVGRFEPEKNYEAVLKAANKLPELEFSIVGVVTDEAYYSKLQRTKPKNVHLLPNLEFSALKDLLAKSKFYLHTMKGEHFGIAIVEAMASGCIPIVHCYGGPSEFVIHGKNGMLYSDSTEVVDHIKTLMKLPDSKLRQMKKEAIKTAKNFDQTIFASKIREVFRRIAYTV